MKVTVKISTAFMLFLPYLIRNSILKNISDILIINATFYNVIISQEARNKINLYRLDYTKIIKLLLISKENKINCKLS
jgi:hypothetical protein